MAVTRTTHKFSPALPGMGIAHSPLSFAACLPLRLSPLVKPYFAFLCPCFCLQKSCRYIFCVDASQHLKRAALLLLKDVLFATVLARTTPAVTEWLPSDFAVASPGPGSAEGQLAERKWPRDEATLSFSEEEDYTAGEGRGVERSRTEFPTDSAARPRDASVQSGETGEGASDWERTSDEQARRGVVQALEDLVDLTGLLKRVSGDLVERGNLLGSSVKAAALLLLGKWSTMVNGYGLRLPCNKGKSFSSHESVSTESLAAQGQARAG